MKKRKRKFGGTRQIASLIVIGIFIYSSLNGIVLRFSDLNQSSLLSKFSEIHFSSPGNSFGGGVFWLNTKTLDDPITIKLNGIPKTCNKQLRGIYYNAVRGSRLWPLDKDTLAIFTGSNGFGYDNLEVSGGLFTSCGSGEDQYNIIGYVKHNRQGIETYLIGGTKMNYQQNNYSNEFSNSFQYFNNVTPLGYIWDSVGGIGFIGGALSGSENLINNLNNNSINDSFVLSGGNIVSASDNRDLTSGETGVQAQDTMRNILIQGNVILSKAIDTSEKRAFMGNINKKSVLMNSDLNSATVINAAKKNSEVLCRGKEYVVGGKNAIKIENNNQNSILCYKDTDHLEIDLKESALYKDKTIVMKNGNIVLKNSMTNESPALDIFIDQGNLYISQPVDLDDTIAFDSAGYPTNKTATNNGIFIKGNIIINGLLLGGIPSSEKSINNKVHLLGKIAFLNMPTSPSIGRTSQITSLLKTEVFNNWISLEKLFSWYCNFEGKASDGSDCDGSSSISTTPFVVLNANYPSKILK